MARPRRGTLSRPSLLTALSAVVALAAAPAPAWAARSQSGSTPTAPTALSAKAGDRQVALSWSASTDSVDSVAGYYIYRNSSRVAQTASTTYTDAGLTDGTAYGYDVVAYDSSGKVSKASSTVSATPVDTTPPSAPTSLTGTPGDGQVSLVWGASTDNVGVAGYDIFRNGALVGQTASTSFTDLGLTDGTPDSYYVEAFDSARNVSAASNTLSLTPVAATSSGGSTAGTPVSCTLYASPSGSSANAGTQSAPKDLLSMAASLSAGQTGCLLSGTYGATPDTTGNTPDTGTYWHFTTSGTPTAQITVTAAPGDTSVPTILGWFREDGSYVTWSHVNIDGSNTYQDACATQTANNWSASATSVPSDCYTSSGDPCPNATATARYRSQDVDLNGAADVFDHVSIYQSIASLRYNLAGIGFQASTSGDVIRYSLLHDGGGCGTQHDHLLYVHTSTGGAQIYDNWFYNANSGQAMILYPDSNGTHVYDNVMDASPSGYSIGGTGSANNTLDHNIATDLGTMTYDSGSTTPGSLISCWQPGTGNTIDTGDWYSDPGGAGSCTGATVTNITNLDPQFANPAAHDYTVNTGTLTTWGLPALSQMGPQGS